MEVKSLNVKNVETRELKCKHNLKGEQGPNTKKENLFSQVSLDRLLSPSAMD